MFRQEKKGWPYKTQVTEHTREIMFSRGCDSTLLAELSTSHDPHPQSMKGWASTPILGIWWKHHVYQNMCCLEEVERLTLAPVQKKVLQGMKKKKPSSFAVWVLELGGKECNLRQRKEYLLGTYCVLGALLICLLNPCQSSWRIF